jgi:hypothetical protein
MSQYQILDIILEKEFAASAVESSHEYQTKG